MVHGGGVNSNLIYCISTYINTIVNMEISLFSLRVYTSILCFI